MPPDHPRARLRARALAAAVPVSLLVLPAVVVRRVSDPSPWLHLKVGEFLADGGRFGLPDPWAPFAAHAYVPTQWLPSVVTAQLYPHLGTPLLAWERAAGIAVLSLALLLWASRITRLWVAGLVTATAVFAAWPSLTERPQLAGFILLVPVLAAWWRTATDHRARWWLVPLTWLAASVHGIWATGAAIGGVIALTVIVSGQVRRPEAMRILGVLGGCAVAAALTPVGPRLLLTPFAVSGQGRQFVQEWMPSSVRSPHVLAALALLALAWWCWVGRGRRIPGWHVILVLVACALTLSMERTVAVAAIVAVPLVSTAVETALREKVDTSAASSSDHSSDTGFGASVPTVSMPRVQRLGWVAATAVGLAFAAPVAAARTDEPVGIPLRLASQLGALPQGTQVLVDGDTSGWLMYAAPQLRPVYDLRVESYTAHQVEGFIGAMSADPGWQDYVRVHDVTVALVPSQSPVGAALVEQDRWNVLGRDGDHVLLQAGR